MVKASFSGKAEEAACMGVGGLAGCFIGIDTWMEGIYEHVPFKHALIIFGSKIDNAANSTTGIMYKRAKAKQRFWANHTQIMNKNAGKLKTLTAWMGICGKSALYDCGGGPSVSPNLANSAPGKTDFYEK